MKWSIHSAMFNGNDIPETHRECSLSVAYVTAIAARAGISVKFGGQANDYGVDGDFKLVRKLTTRRFKEPTKKQLEEAKQSGLAITPEPRIILKEFGVSVPFQLKSTMGCRSVGTDVKYDAHPDAFDKLVDIEDSLPTLLIVCSLPRETDWFSVNADHARLGGTCFYHFVSGPLTTNGTSVTITIPNTQVLNETSILKVVHDYQNLYNVNWDGGANASNQ